MMAGALGGLDEIGERELDLRAVADAAGQAGVGLVVPPAPEFEDAARVAGERQLVALALPGGFARHRVQQGLGLLGLAPPGRDEQRADAPVPPAGLLDGDPLVEAPFRLGQPPGQQLGHPRVAERERQRDGRALLPGLGFHPPGQLVQCDVVGQDGGVRAGCGEPAEGLGGRPGLVAGRADRPAELRRGGLQTVQLQRRVRVQQQVTDRGRDRREAAGATGRPAPHPPASRRPGELAVDLGLHHGLDQDVPGQPDIDRPQLGGRVEQRGGGVRRAAHGVPDPALHPLGQPVVARVAVGGGLVEHGLGPAGSPAVTGRPGGAEHPAGPGRLARAQHRGALVERLGAAPPAAAPGPVPGPLQLGRHGLVEPAGRHGQVPGPPVRVGRPGRSRRRGRRAPAGARPAEPRSTRPSGSAGGGTRSGPGSRSAAGPRPGPPRPR